MPEIPGDCVARVRAGDLEAFEALFRAMHAPLLAFGTRYVGDAARAEELVQDVFFTLWERRAEWIVTGSVPAYLFSAVRSRALNVRRRDAVEQRWADDEAHEHVRALHPAPPRADTMLETMEARARLETAMAALPPRLAQVMLMRWYGGLSYAEIANTLGISVKGVENQLGRGLKALRAALGSG
ncbi:RNA polymerase sigma-70 factor [Gemmatimonas sp.]|uniref:RNA polymerase sigma-70 factor n=1 Tax=Gemmatimonas sp. TaxID=1962908 RepID=UPI0022BD4315|nr:RNA polymerase sigma-70 factor [Gemmatimonas sp.]MCA2988988.1 RNA polymerase sigma-70 factor [Gemmatimonas sp.]MCA2989404.1 RNA polymerase sigma-70 factor [Gemmatimonas sp.]MCE2952866.1 RNA polymerase sigma-70 factor [Gemmatimonas sp.]MCZ8011881.1 RNA polymerase sigma-70 factor [Gemmatimonas sp.]MCZ8265570.1 RNA polymerase sigma-70 factor [Gemmatimonas sp.]